MAKKFGFKRPVVYSFGHVKDFIEIINDVKPWKGVEGIVIYSNKDQSLHKIKADDYLSRHRLKSELSSLENNKSAATAKADIWRLFVSQGRYR